jgi:L-ascorbate metabolism protein UlaG (beta-lactamase superfamily)
MARNPILREPGGQSRMRTAAVIARSGVRRYPSELAASLSRAGQVPALAPIILETEGVEGPLAASWLGHATVLLRIGDRWVLTDPVFSHRIGLPLGRLVVGVERRLPLVDPSSLPPIDLILISHAHFDHLDKPTLRALASARTRVITARHTRRLIPGGFRSVQELHWGETADLGRLTVRAVRPSHWGARTAWDRHRGFNSYVIESRGRGRSRVLFAGDTAVTDAFDAVGGVDLSIFGIGAYDPWIAHHANPEQVWEMHEGARGAHLLPMHHSTFKLSDEPIGEPMERLLAAAGGRAQRVVGRDLGRLWVPG